VRSDRTPKAICTPALRPGPTDSATAAPWNGSSTSTRRKTERPDHPRKVQHLPLRRLQGKGHRPPATGNDGERPHGQDHGGHGDRPSLTLTVSWPSANPHCFGKDSRQGHGLPALLWYTISMLTPVVRKARLSELDSAREDLLFWLARPAEERLAAVELLRRQMHGVAPRLQRTARVIQRARG